MSAVFQHQIVVANLNRVAVTIATVTETFAVTAGTVYDTVNDLLTAFNAWMDLTFGAGRANWTTAHTLFLDVGATNTVEWLTGAPEVMAALGFAADVTDTATGSNPPSQLVLADTPQSGDRDYAFKSKAMTHGALTTGGVHLASHVYGSTTMEREIVANLKRESNGDWSEIENWFDFLTAVADGRQFTIWPEDTDAEEYTPQGPSLDLRMIGPDVVPLTRRYPGEWTHFRARINCIEVL